MQEITPSILDAVEFGEAHPNPTIRQYAKSARRIFCTWRGFGDGDLAEMPADLATYDRHAPRYSKKNETLKRQLIWRKDTYQQYQRGGRLLIEHYTGERAAKVARKAITHDDFAELARRAALLAAAGLVEVQRLSILSTITDLSRAANLRLVDLTNAIVADLRESAPSEHQKTLVVKGAGFLDDLRIFSELACLLPAEPIGPIEPLRRKFKVPEHLREPLEAWIETATTIYPEDIKNEKIRQKLAERHAPGSRGIFQAAFRNYIDTLGRRRPISPAHGLPDLFAETDVDEVVSAWEQASGEPGGLCARTNVHVHVADRGRARSQ